MTVNSYVGDPQLKCGPENLQALTAIYRGLVAALPAGAELDGQALTEAHAYFADPEILAAVQAAALVT